MRRKPVIYLHVIGAAICVLVFSVLYLPFFVLQLVADILAWPFRALSVAVSRMLDKLIKELKS